MKFNEQKIEIAIENLLTGLGIQWKSDDNFRETPQRVMRAYKEMNIGLYEEYTRTKLFPSNYKGIVFFKKIDAVGLCPHHLLPIEYEINFAYIPSRHVLGLSKVPRILKNLCARPLLQEDLTKDIIEYFQKKLHPIGIAIVVNGTHGCMKYRGIKEAEVVKTSEMTGPFMSKPATREEFFNLIK